MSRKRREEEKKNLHQVALRIDDDMYALLSQQAAEQHRSLNQQVIHLLSLVLFKYPFNQYPWNNLRETTELPKPE